MYCRNCGNEIDSNAAICVKCGFKKGQGEKYCQNCGKETSSGQSVCLGCGFKIGNCRTKSGTGSAASGEFVPEDKRVLCAVLAFLLNIGIHNFLLGETHKGILKIILTVTFIGIPVAVVLSWIEAFKILNGSYVVDTEKWI